MERFTQLAAFEIVFRMFLQRHNRRSIGDAKTLLLCDPNRRITRKDLHKPRVCRQLGQSHPPFSGQFWSGKSSKYLGGFPWTSRVGQVSRCKRFTICVFLHMMNISNSHIPGILWHKLGKSTPKHVHSNSSFSDCHFGPLGRHGERGWLWCRGCRWSFVECWVNFTYLLDDLAAHLS